MKVMDRYVTTMFIKIFAICMICWSGLYVVVDAFTNLEEFVELASKSAGLATLLRAYYAPRILQLFDRSVALLALSAAIGTLVWMQRYNELAAIEAGGIPKARIVRPILWCMLCLVAASIVNRELLIPHHREALARNAQSWDGNQPRAITPQQDHQSGVWLLSGKITPASGLVADPMFRLPDACSDFGKSISSKTAQLVEANKRHPAGFLLQQVQRAAELSQQASVPCSSGALVLTPRDNEWLKPDELFIVSGISRTELSYGQELRRFGSLRQQITAQKNPSIWTSSRQRVDMHCRVVRPALDFSILLIGLPLVVSRRERNIFMALGTCLVVVLGIQVLVITCHQLGAARLVSSAALAAWLPIMVLLPSGLAMQARLRR